jgi:hypothetical protein
MKYPESVMPILFAFADGMFAGGEKKPGQGQFSLLFDRSGYNSCSRLGE